MATETGPLTPEDLIILSLQTIESEIQDKDIIFYDKRFFDEEFKRKVFAYEQKMKDSRTPEEEECIRLNRERIKSKLRKHWASAIFTGLLTFVDELESPPLRDEHFSNIKKELPKYENTEEHRKRRKEGRYAIEPEEVSIIQTYARDVLTKIGEQVKFSGKVRQKLIETCEAIEYSENEIKNTRSAA